MRSLESGQNEMGKREQSELMSATLKLRAKEGRTLDNLLQNDNQQSIIPVKNETRLNSPGDLSVKKQVFSD